MQKNIIISLIFAIIISLFAILNAGVVPVNLIFIKVDISAALVILISACIGAIIVYSMNTISGVKGKKIRKDFDKNYNMTLSENDQLKLELEKLNKEVEDLKSKVKKLKSKENRPSWR